MHLAQGLNVEGTGLTAEAESFARTLRLYLRQRSRGPVAMRETHISWVLLTKRLAFKLKKPVRLPFVDFSTVSLRHHYCLEELRLNRRFAPGLYRAVLPVRGSVHAPTIGGAGEVIDHVLCMRRFPDGALLAERLAAQAVEPEQLDRLAVCLADAHAAAPAAAPASRYGSPRSVVSAAHRVLRQLQSADEVMPALSDLRISLAREAARLRPVWRRRQGEGRVRECHGDLHLGNVVALGDELVPFDCIEFDPALRWIDVMSDVAFLTMDLAAHGRSDLSFRFLDAYLQRSGDWDGLRVLRWYEVERALVRALVRQLVARSAPSASLAPAGPDYFAFAQRRADPRLQAPRLMITCGLSGSGKSSVAQALLEAAGAVRLRSDVERKRLFGLPADARSAAAGIDLYGADTTRRTYEQLARLAALALDAGYPVIVDAAFLKRCERMDFRAIAKARGLPFTILHCHAPLDVLEERVRARAEKGLDPSEADVPVLHRQRLGQEAPQADEAGWTIELATDRPVDGPQLARDWAARAATG